MKLQIHPQVRLKWEDGHIVIGRQDLPFEFPVANDRGISLIHHFATPTDPASVAAKLGGSPQVKIFIENLKNHKILVTIDEAEGKTLPFDISAVDDGTFSDIYRQCKEFNMGDVYMNFALFQAVRYIANANIEGDMIETGVFRGGSSMLIALTLLKYGVTDKKIFLYDSFDFTFPSVSEHDAEIYGRDNKKTKKLVENLKQRANQEKNNTEGSPVSLDIVRHNLLSTGYPKENLVFIKGYVQDTIPAQTPKQAALLRLDTDFYESTLHELRNLYPLLAKGGVLLIDDYPTEVGATVATDQFLKESGTNILLHRIGVQGRIGVCS